MVTRAVQPVKGGLALDGLTNVPAASSAGGWLHHVAVAVDDARDRLLAQVPPELESTGGDDRRVDDGHARFVSRSPNAERDPIDRPESLDSFRRSEAALQYGRNGRRARRAGHGHRRLPPVSKLEHVVRASGLGAWTDRRRFPAAERLAPHDRAGDVAIDVEAAGLDPPEPAIDLAIV